MDVALIVHARLTVSGFCLPMQGCEFRATLLEDGILETENSKTFPTPQQWLNSCWAALGHQKKLNKKQSYKTVSN